VKGTAAAPAAQIQHNMALHHATKDGDEYGVGVTEVKLRSEMGSGTAEE
jgi:hypothetical protein